MFVDAIPNFKINYNRLEMNENKKPIKISDRLYKYKGYDIRFHGHNPPNKYAWWETVNEKTGCKDYCYTTLKRIIKEIDEDEKLA